MRAIAEAWEGYRRTVLDPDAGPVQVRETRRAFFAGAVMVYLINIEIARDGVSEAQSFAMLDQLHAELDEFCQSSGTPWEGAHHG